MTMNKRVFVEKRERFRTEAADMLAELRENLKLEADGLVEKVRSETDGRQWAVRLTKSGQAEAARLKAEYDKQVSKMMDCFSQEQLNILHELLGTMFTHWNTVDLGLEQKNTGKENE